MKQYDLSAIMSRAWTIFRKGGIVFAEALHRAWQSAKARPQNAAAIAAAKAAAGIAEDRKRGLTGKRRALKWFTAARRFSAPS